MSDEAPESLSAPARRSQPELYSVNRLLHSLFHKFFQGYRYCACVKVKGAMQGRRVWSASAVTAHFNHAPTLKQAATQ